jgi:pimeloyl-ACP methyl ester carboxylesterase
MRRAARRIAMEHLVRDGVSLCYTEQGSGDPPLLFVHGWCCDHTHFQPQVDRFSRDHRCVAVDLRGHGESDKPVQDYSMAAFADDLAWLCMEIGLQKPVVIGHSMGGVIGVAIAQRHPQLASAVVLVDSPVAIPTALGPQIEQVVAGLRSPAFREVARGFVENAMFLPHSDPALKQRIAEGMSAAPQHVMVSALEQIFSFDSAAAAADCKLPLLNLMAANPLVNVPRLQELCPQVVTGQTVGSGHFNQLEVPDQVNAMLERFIATSVRSAATAAAT